MTAACQSCKAPIFWARTTNNKPIPIDADQDPDGLITIHRETGQLAPTANVHSTKNPPPADTPRYTSHFATCPNTRAHRRKTVERTRP